VVCLSKQMAYAARELQEVTGPYVTSATCCFTPSHVFMITLTPIQEQILMINVVLKKPIQEVRTPVSNSKEDLSKNVWEVGKC